MENHRSAAHGTSPGPTAQGAASYPRGEGWSGGQGTGTGSGTQDVADEARYAAHEAKHETKAQVRTGLEMGKSRAAGALHGVAESLLQSCRTSEDGATRYIQQAGERVQHAAHYLQNTDVREMVGHTERFARRQPALFLGGAFTLGLVAARFLKSSERGEQQDGGHDAVSAGPARSSRYDRERQPSGYEAPSYAGTSTTPQGGGASSIGPMTPLGTSSAGVAGSAGTSRGMGTEGRSGTGGTSGSSGTPGSSGTMSADTSTAASGPGSTPPGSSRRGRR
jgi:hypothetical protein